jgi:hypothetical protein
MADNVSSGVANSILALILNGTAFSGFATPYVQLHTGLPGAAGTTNIAAENRRQATGAFAAPAGGSTTNNSAINWTSVLGTETYSHVSIWSASSAGTFICSGSISASAITIGQNFQIPAGGMTVSLPVAS